MRYVSILPIICFAAWHRNKKTLLSFDNFDVVNYGSRDEITRAVRKIMTDVEEGKIAPEDMTEEVFASYLDTAGIPDPDLMIRTSGELRLSNYLLWQLAYSELYVTECLWPDFNKEELLNAIRQYNKRERRFGGVTAVKTE